MTIIPGSPITLKVGKHFSYLVLDSTHQLPIVMDDDMQDNETKRHQRTKSRAMLLALATRYGWEIIES